MTRVCGCQSVKGIASSAAVVTSSTSFRDGALRSGEIRVTTENGGVLISDGAIRFSSAAPSRLSNVAHSRLS